METIFNCDCSPEHEFTSLEEFNQHFTTIHHKFFECSTQSLYADNQVLRERLHKMTEERNQWRNKYFDSKNMLEQKQNSSF